MTVKVTVQIDGGKSWNCEMESEHDAEAYNEVVNLLLLYGRAKVNGYVPITLDPFQSEEPREP